MTEFTQDPVRLLDDPSFGAALQQDVAAAAQAKVAGLNLAGGLSSLKAAVAAEAGSTGVVAPIAAGGMSTAGKIAVGVAIAVGLGAAWWGLSGEDAGSGGDPAAMVQAPEVPPPARTETTPGPVATPSIVPPPPAPTPAVALPTEEEAVPAEEEVVVIDEDDAPKPHARKPGHTGGHKKKTAAAPLSAQDAIEEASLISRARASLAGSPKQALALTTKAKRQFPGGMLGEEREAIAIQALAKLGRAEEANARGKRFLGAHTASPHAAAVRRAIQTAP